MIKDYQKSLAAFRLKAMNDFFEAHENHETIVKLMDEFLTESFNKFEGPDYPEVENGSYIYMLILSYIRSHHIINEHIFYSELVEAAVLIRKQFELLSRLHELKTENVDDLIRKTPNLKHVETKINELYSMYSEISHSASPDFNSLFGSKEVDGKKLLTLYPEYQENTIIAFQHNLMCFFEFLKWMVGFKEETLSDYDRSKDEKVASDLLVLGAESGLIDEEVLEEN